MMGPSDLGVTARETEVSHKAILRSRSWLMCFEVRWVNAIWTVLERTRATPAMDRTSSLRVNRPTSLISNSEADGSASTYYVPRPPGTAPGSEGHLSPSPFAGPSRQTFTTDDAVIQTTGGFTASLAQRGSRRLAVGGLERGRSLRRVASEGDLSESAGVQEEPLLTPGRFDIPLTAESARLRASSRDFTFARGISPPPLTSPPPRYRSPVAASIQTAVVSTAIDTYDLPQLAISEASSSGISGTIQTALESQTRSSICTFAQESLGSAARDPALPAATRQLGSPFREDEERFISDLASSDHSVSSYASAPPPVPSRDSRSGSASVGPSRQASPIQYQLHDAAVSGYFDSAVPDERFDRASAVTHAGNRMSGAYRSALSTFGPDSSDYSSAPPPHISRSTSPGMPSLRSDLQDREETATGVSEPESDIELIADLERFSSMGSDASRPLRRRAEVYAKSRYDTAETHSSSDQQSQSSVDTLCVTARSTAYATAPSWHTQMSYTEAADGGRECINVL